MEYYKKRGANKINFSNEAREKWVQERSDDLKNEQKRILEEVACPKCGTKNLIDDINENTDKSNWTLSHVMSQNIILNEHELECLGFSSDQNKAKDNGLIFAPHGICVGKCGTLLEVPEIKDQDRFVFGTPLQLMTELEKAELFRKTHRKTEDGEFIPLLFGEESVRGGLGEINIDLIKNVYYNCIKLEDQIPLYPPYYVGEKTTGGSGDRQEDASGRYLKGQDMVSSNREDEWWPQLRYLLQESERANRNKRPHPTRRTRLLLSAYYDKTSRLKHVESLWSFMRRLRLNRNEMKHAFKHWPESTPLFEKTVFDSNIKPTEHRVDGLLTVINNSCVAVTLSKEEISEISTGAKEILAKLTSLTIPGGKSTLADHFYQNAWFAATSPSKYKISFNATRVPAPAFLESLCVIEAAKSVLDSAVVQSLSKYYLFPDDGVKTPWWKSNFTEGCYRNYEGWDLLMRYIKPNQQ